MLNFYSIFYISNWNYYLGNKFSIFCLSYKYYLIKYPKFLNNLFIIESNFLNF